jgi:GT2 family glycosyltransferase
MSVEDWPKVAIIVLNWNGWRDTIKCLESLCKQNYNSFEIFVLDNGSTDDSGTEIKNWLEKNIGPSIGLATVLNVRGYAICREYTSKIITLLKSTVNSGFAEGVNIVIAYLLTQHERPSYIFLVNNDAQVEVDCLKKCVLTAQLSKASIVSPLIIDEKGKVLFNGGSAYWELFFKYTKKRCPSNATYWASDRAHGCAMLIDFELVERRFEEEGYLFVPQLFMYCEEIDLAFLGKRWHYKTVVTSATVVHHKAFGSSLSRCPTLPHYYWTRNRIFLARMYLPWYLRLVFYNVYGTLRILRIITRVFARRKGQAMAIWEGLVDGYKGVTGQWRKHPR